VERALERNGAASTLHPASRLDYLRVETGGQRRVGDGLMGSRVAKGYACGACPDERVIGQTAVQVAGHGHATAVGAAGQRGAL